MSKKEEINKEDLEFLKELFRESNTEEEETQDFKKIKNFEKRIPVSFLKDDLKQFDKQSERINRIGSIKLESEITDLKYSQRLTKEPKKRKIKKKQLFLEIAEALPLIKENNIMLNKLIQALSQGSIKVQILK